MSSTVGLHVPPNVLLVLKVRHALMMKMTVSMVYNRQNLDDWSFDVFSVNEAGDGHALKYVGYELLQRYDLITKFKVSAGHTFHK
jgi:calcium/calmodulin-dependent 3',5'-cyclic nucleotide phosphodiesterase